MSALVNACLVVALAGWALDIARSADPKPKLDIGCAGLVAFAFAALPVPLPVTYALTAATCLVAVHFLVGRARALLNAKHSPHNTGSRGQ